MTSKVQKEENMCTRSLFLYFNLVAEVLTIEIMPSMGLRRIYITGLDILMEACVLCTPVIQRVLTQKIFWCGNGESNPLKGQGRSSPDFSGVPLSSTYLSPEASAWLFPKEAGPVTSSVHRGTAHSTRSCEKAHSRKDCML